ncbi:hypothetical protein JOL62DRAFT_266748 [Phyllosticta paracitricarpa]|uniref:Secreted protein n=1 Tax=Phyllosticta paracitricarpa TaxID=2016321 RepID=A0ABR1MZV2_9PEZI
MVFWELGFCFPSVACGWTGVHDMMSVQTFYPFFFFSCQTFSFCFSHFYSLCLAGLASVSQSVKPMQEVKRNGLFLKWRISTQPK